MTEMRKDIGTTIVRILEDWAMMLAEPALENSTKVFNPEMPCYVAYLKFKGVVNGQYSVICQEGFARILAANLIGEDENNSDSERMDALREMANVIGGNLLTTKWGEDTAFDLSSPNVELMSLEKADEYFHNQAFCYLAEEQPVAVTFTLTKD